MRLLLGGPLFVLVAVLALELTWLERRHDRKRRAVAPPAEAEPREAPSLRWRERAWTPPAEAPPPPRPLPKLEVRTLRLRPWTSTGLRVPVVDLTLQRRADEGEDEEDPETIRLDASVEGVFTLHWLPPGTYDLTVAAAGLRDGHAEWAASGEGDAPVEVRLDRSALVQGAVGGARRDCRRLRVRLTQRDSTEQIEDLQGPRCTFSAPVEETTPAVVGARLPEGTVRTTVAIPEEGDPPPLCLAPPCPWLPSALAVWVADARGELVVDASVSWEVMRPDGAETMTIAMLGGASSVTFVTDLRAGDRVHLRADHGDQEGEADAVAGFGVTDVVVRLSGG